jgi:hypothetical protein
MAFLYSNNFLNVGLLAQLVMIGQQLRCECTRAKYNVCMASAGKKFLTLLIQ